MIIVRLVDTLVVERHDGVVTVTMNRPQKKNAVTGTMTSELTSVFRDVGFNPFRQQRRRSSDYVMVAAAFAVIAALLVWALLA